ncbi:hypothetical protein Ciccas_014617, partial [Cichlidogyrus casuarinus]
MILERCIMGFILDLHPLIYFNMEAPTNFRAALLQINQAIKSFKMGDLSFETIRKLMVGNIHAINAEDATVAEKKVALISKIWLVKVVMDLNIPSPSENVPDTSFEHITFSYANTNEHSDEYLRQLLRRQLEGSLFFLTHLRVDDNQVILGSHEITQSVVFIEVLRKMVFFLLDDSLQSQFQLRDLLSKGFEIFATGQSLMDRFKMFLLVIEEIIYSLVYPPVLVYYICMYLSHEALRIFLGEEHATIQ